MKRFTYLMAVIMVLCFCSVGVAQTYSNGKMMLDMLFMPSSTLTANSATPSVADGSYWKTANSNPTTITAMPGGMNGQVINILVTDANTTFDFTGTTLKGNRGADYAASQYDLITCLNDGTNWNCTVPGSGVNLTNGTATLSVDSVTANSFTANKVSGTPGTSLLYEANSTDTDTVGWRGPASIASSWQYQFSSSPPAAGQIMLFGVPAGTPAVSAQTWENPILTTTNVYDYDFIPVKYMDDGIAAPAALADTGATNKVKTRAFSGSADNDLRFMWKIPYGVDSTVAIQYRVAYYITSATLPDETANTNAGEGAVWTLAGTAVRSGIDTQDATLGTAVKLTTVMGSVAAAGTGTWTATNNYAANDFVIPTAANGLYYKCTTDNGSSGGTEPTWPTAIGGTVADGDLVWTCMGYNVPAQWTMIKTAWSGNVTVTNYAADKYAVLSFTRQASTEAGDNYAQTLAILGIEIRYAKKLQGS